MRISITSRLMTVPALFAAALSSTQPFAAEGSDGLLGRVSASAWWAAPSGTPSGVPAAGDLGQLDSAPGLMAQASLVAPPLVPLPTISIGGTTWSSDSNTVEVQTRDLWAIASWGLPLGIAGVGVGAGAHATSLRITPSAAGSAAFDHLEVIPVLAGSLWVSAPLTGIEIGADAHVGALGSRRLTTAQLTATWSFAGPLGVTGGYRYEHVELGSRGEADLTLQGPFIGVALTF